MTPLFLKQCLKPTYKIFDHILIHPFHKKYQQIQTKLTDKEGQKEKLIFEKIRNLENPFMCKIGRDICKHSKKR